MTVSWCKLWLGLAVVAAVAPAAAPSEESVELVVNPGFACAEKEAMPEGWTAWTPLQQGAAVTVRRSAGGLLMDAPERPFAVGGVYQELKGIVGGEAYAIESGGKLENLPSPLRSLIVRVVWKRGGRDLHPAGMLVRGPTLSAGAFRFRDVLIAPPQADAARLSLELKWPQGGAVCFQKVSVRKTAMPPPRPVKIGTVYLRPRNSTPEKNLDLFCQQIDEAGRLKLDILCLGEAITVVGTGQSLVQAAERIPGPASDRLAAAARKNRLWVVAGLMERDGDRVFNTAVLLDREGKLSGKYRKIHLPREEWLKGITPGDEYPVFKTDFGTVAIQICYDWFFPAVHEILALKGAEIVFAPTWGTTFPDKEGRAEGETVFRVRARDNGIYLVPSVYDGSSMVIDPLGRILVSNQGREGVFWCEVDLSQREPLWWVGQWRAVGSRDRMPGTYGPLLKEGTEGNR